MKDYAEHSKIVTIPQAAKNLWTNLSDFWQEFTDQDLISSAWSAWLKLMDSVFSTVGARNNDVTIFADVYEFTYNQVPVEIFLDVSSGKGYVVQGYDYRQIAQLQDFINDPEIVLVEGTDYTYTTELKTGQQGYINTTQELPDSMWVFYVQDKTIEELIARFGIFVDYSYIRNTEPQTKKDILALMQAQEFGSIIQHIECALCVENDFPFTLYGGTVTAIEGTTAIYISIDDNIEEILNTTGLPFRQRLEDGTWANLAVGDFIVGPSQVIQAVTINDHVLDPDFHHKIPIGDIEKYHTFIVKFNPNLPDPEVAYEIDLVASMRRIQKLKKITSKPYITIMFDFAVDASTGATSYVNLDMISAALVGTSWTNLLLQMEASPETSYGHELDELDCLLTSNYGSDILPLPVVVVFSSHANLGALPAFIGGSSYGGI